MKTALVTGVGRGVGLAIAWELGVNGYQVAVMATYGESFYPEGTRILQDAGISYIWYVGDIGKSENRIHTVREAVEHLGEIHVLINSVGVAPKVRADPLDMIEGSFDYVIGTNIKGNVFMTQTAAQRMMKQSVYGSKRGTITNISSCPPQVSFANRGEYCISRTGVSMLIELSASRLTPKSIFIHEIRPEVVRTDVTGQVEKKYTELVKQGMLPTARWGAPGDVVKTVKAFCSDDLCYTTGDYIDVDGGSHIRRL